MEKTKKKNPIKKEIIILLIVAALLIFYIGIQVTPQKDTPIQEKVSEEIKVDEEIKEKIEDIRAISEEVKELLSLADQKVQSISYRYKGPETKNSIYEFYVKGDMVKYTINPTYKDVSFDEHAYDTIYLNKDSKIGIAYCDSRRCKVKGNKTALDYEETYILTPTDWLDKIEFAEKIGEELIDRRNTWKLSTDNIGTIWIDSFFGIPLQLEIGDDIYQFQKLTFNGVTDEDVTPS